MLNKTGILTVSNILSFLRLLSAVPLWFLLGNARSSSLFVILLIAFFALASDFLDGFFARKFNQVTEFGKIIDPLADKVVTGIVVIRLFLLDEIPGYLFYMIIGRDILIFLGGMILSAQIGKVLPSNTLGKYTVAFIALLLLLIIMNFDKNNFIYILLLYLTVILIVVSFIAYLIRAFEFINKKKYESV